MMAESKEVTRCYLNMISFIVIGRNEGLKLVACLESIVRAAKLLKHERHEVIYVDSSSTDNSVSLAKAFPGVAVFRITGKCNAAVARNIGAKESSGNILFFIDGDMEIEEDFLLHALEGGALKYQCVTGQLLHLTYDGAGKFLCERYEPESGAGLQEEVVRTGGGVFVIERSAWGQAGGMRTKYKRSQDIDLTVRLEKLNIKTIRLPSLIAKHHTIEYTNEDRLWETLRQNYYSYPPMLFRDHILLPYSWFRAMRQNYTAFLLLFAVLMALTSVYGVISFVIYFSAVIVRVAKTSHGAKVRKNLALYIAERVSFQVIKDGVFWLAMAMFFPSDVEEVYEVV